MTLREGRGFCARASHAMPDENYFIIALTYVTLYNMRQSQV